MNTVVKRIMNQAETEKLLKRIKNLENKVKTLEEKVECALDMAGQASRDTWQLRPLT